MVGPLNSVTSSESRVDDAGFGHAVILEPGAVVLVPMPDFAVMCVLGVDFELVQINRPAKRLHRGFDNPWVLAETAEEFA